MKIELKHLAPYLPYALQIGWMEEVEENVFSEIEVAVQMEMTCDNISSFVNRNDWHKPILRPLSDLKKTITVRGETFIPINKLKGLFGWDYLWNEYHKEKQPFNVFALRYASLSKLLEWNFDVFNLIENGLAIDINTLNKHK